MQALVDRIVNNFWIAVLAASILGTLGFHFPPFAVLSGSVISVVTLRKAWQQGFIVMLAAAIPVFLAWFWQPKIPGMVFPLVFILWPPLLLASETLRRTASQGHALLILGIAVAAFDLGMHVFTGDVVEFWQDWIKNVIASIPKAKIPEVENQSVLRLWNGFVGLLYGVGLISALFIARWMQALAYYPGGFRMEFRELRLPRMALVIAVAAVWLGGLYDPILQGDWFIAAMLIFSVAGLATLLGYMALRKFSPSWNFPLYLTVILFPSLAIPGLAMIGAMDCFIDFRNQGKRPP